MDVFFNDVNECHTSERIILVLDSLQSVGV